MSLCRGCKKMRYFAVHPDLAKFSSRYFTWEQSRGQLFSVNEFSFPRCYRALGLRLFYLPKYFLFRRFSTSQTVLSGLLKSGTLSWHIVWSCSLIFSSVLPVSSKSAGACCWQKEGSNLVMAALKTLVPSLFECHRLLAKTVDYTQMAWNTFYFVTWVVDH